MKKPALGKGLDAILGPRRETTPETESTRRGEAPERHDRLLFVDIEKVSAGRGQPRRIFRDTAIDELAASIREKGIIQPLVVTQSPGGYELIAGERRLRAAARAGLARVPVIVNAEIEPGELMELALIENVQREDLMPMELARAYQKLIDQHHYTQDQLAKKIGKSRTSITNTLRLLALPEPVRQVLEQELITEGHARALLGLPTAALQISVCRTVVRKSLSVRETETLVRSETGHDEPAGQPSAAKPVRQANPDLAAVEARLERSLSTRVRIRGDAAKGRLEVHFFSRDELEGLIERLTAT
jgi:ParB family chromosome partitioning protein